MKPEQDCCYFIDYQTDGKDSSETSYQGPGTFSGKIIETPDGEELYWMINLLMEYGFTDGGWFSSSDIKAELKYEQERKTS